MRDNELIQGYLDRSLTEKELHEVEYRLKEEPALKSMHKEYSLLLKGIRYGHLQQKLETLKNLEATAAAKVSDKIEARQVFWEPVAIALRHLYWQPIAIAACILLLVGVWFTMQPSLPANDRLYAEYFEPFDSPGSGLTRGSDNEMTLKAQAYEAYDAGDYAQAAGLFEKALLEKDDPIMHLCLGNAYLKTGNAEKAGAAFQHILDKHGDLVTQATWYLALTYLKEGNLERTKASLWEISQSSTYGEKARKLLKELE